MGKTAYQMWSGKLSYHLVRLGRTRYKDNGKVTKDYKDGKISMGLGIGCVLDDYIRFKRKQLNIVKKSNTNQTSIFDYEM